MRHRLADFASPNHRLPSLSNLNVDTKTTKSSIAVGRVNRGRRRGPNNPLEPMATEAPRIGINSNMPIEFGAELSDLLLDVI